MTAYTILLQKLSQDSIPKPLFNEYVQNISGLYADVNTQIELLKLYGFPFKENGDMIELSTASLSLKEAIFCFVDIETTGAKPQEHSIIEIGALKYQNGKIIDRFESYVFTNDVPQSISQLTGIYTHTLSNAPQPKEILLKFREFVRDSIFVAHNVGFDFNFLNASFERYAIPLMLLPKLCTIELARKTILAPRYALSFLNTFLGINTPISHRAYADALTALEVFKIASFYLPAGVDSVKHLLEFSKKGRKVIIS